MSGHEGTPLHPDLPGGKEQDVPTPAHAQSVVHSPDFVDAMLLRVHDDLKALLSRDDLDPGVRASLVGALANVSLAAQDLGLVYEMLYDLGA